MFILNSQIKLGSKIASNLIIKTLSEWKANNPVVPEGVLTYSSDTHELRLGDGVSRYSDLPLIANTEDIIDTDVPTDDKLYARLNKKWCVVDSENRIVTYSTPIIEDINISEDIGFDWQIENNGLSMNYDYQAMFKRIEYIPSLLSLVAAPYYNNKPLFLSRNGLSWSELDIIKPNTNVAISNVFYIPDYDYLAVQYNNATLSMYSIEQGGINPEPIYTINKTVQSYIVDGDILYIAPLAEYTMYKYNLGTGKEVNAVPYANSYYFGKLLFNSATNQWIGVRRTYDFNVNSLIYATENDPNGFLLSSAGTIYYKHDCICNVDNIYYALVKQNNVYKIIATQDITNHIIMKEWELPEEAISSNRIYKFDYLNKAKLFYILNYDKVLISPDLTHWLYKELPSGCYPGLVNANNTSYWINIAYAKHLKSLVFVCKDFQGYLNVSNVVS